MYLLDTNVISALRRADRAPQVAAWLRGQDENGLYLSSITIGEIARGIRQQEQRDPGFARDLTLWLDRTVQIFADRILPFEAEDARIWGRLSAEIGHNGADLMIAASGLRHRFTIVTGNLRDFAPTGVDLFDPFSG